MEPPFGLERRGRGLWHVKVAQHRLVATGTDLALLTDGKHLIRVNVNNLDLRLSHRLANRLGLVLRGIVVMRVGNDAVQFRLSENDRKLAVKFLLNATDQSGRDHRGTRYEGTQRRKVTTRSVGGGEQHGQHWRHGEHERALFALDRLEDGRRVKAWNPELLSVVGQPSHRNALRAA